MAPFLKDQHDREAFSFHQSKSGIVEAERRNLSYDISINIGATGAENVAAELRKIELAFQQLQNLGKNLGTSSGISSLSSAITQLNTNITNFSNNLSNAVTKANALAAALRSAAASAASMSGALNKPFTSNTPGSFVASGGGGASFGGAAGGRGGGIKSYADMAYDAQNRANQSTLTRTLGLTIRNTESIDKFINELGRNTIHQRHLDLKNAEKLSKVLKTVGEDSYSVDPRMTKAGFTRGVKTRLDDQIYSEAMKELISRPSYKKAAYDKQISHWRHEFPELADVMMGQRDAAFNTPKSLFASVKDKIGASPFGMASVFMLRYRLMTSILNAIASSASTLAGAGRADMVGPNFELASIGFNAPMRAGLEGRAIGLSNLIPGLTIPNYFKAAAQVGSALDVKERGVGNIAQGTRAALMFSSLSNLSPEAGGQLLSRSYYALENTPEFKGMQAGSAMEKIAALMTGAISVSGAWGPDITKSFAHFLPMGVQAGMNLSEMLAFTSTLTTQGFHAGSGGRYGKWLLGSKGMDFMANAMLYGGGEAGKDYYDSRTTEAMRALKAQGIKPGQAKQINKDIARELGKTLAERFAEDPMGTLAMIGEKTKSALEKGFTLKDLGGSQDFLAALMKTFPGGGTADMQEMLRRIQEEGTLGGMQRKYEEAQEQEPGAAWTKATTAVSNFADALSKTTPMLGYISDFAAFLSKMSLRMAEDTTYSRGGTIEARTGMPFSSVKQGKIVGARERAHKAFEDYYSSGPNGYGLNPLDSPSEKKRNYLNYLEYYQRNWQDIWWLPREWGTAALDVKRSAGQLWADTKKSYYSSRLHTSEELEKARLGKSPIIYKRMLERNARLQAGIAEAEKDLEYYRGDSDPYTQSEAFFTKGDKDILNARMSNKFLSLPAQNWWRQNWKQTMGVKNIADIYSPSYWGEESFSYNAPPPTTAFKWGYNKELFGLDGRKVPYTVDDAVPEMSDVMSRQGRLDISSVGTALSELVAAIRNAANAINAINPKGPNTQVPPAKDVSGAYTPG